MNRTEAHFLQGMSKKIGLQNLFFNILDLFISYLGGDICQGASFPAVRKTNINTLWLPMFS